MVPILSGSKPRFAASERTILTARCPSSHALWWIGSPFGRGVRYTKLTHWKPMAVNFFAHISTSPTSQQLPYPPPEMRIMQHPFGFAGASRQSR